MTASDAGADIQQVKAWGANWPEAERQSPAPLIG
jgi:hypothetical protein